MCIYTVFGREVDKFKVIFGVYKVRANPIINARCHELVSTGSCILPRQSERTENTHYILYEHEVIVACSAKL
jgi:hypothetical protein